MSSLPMRVEDVAYRNKVVRLESAIEGLEQAEGPVSHFFTDNGLYCRSFFLAKHNVVVGSVHKYSHIFILVEGDMSILTPTGVQRLTGPLVQVGVAGTKRVIFAHEDTLLLTVHKTDCTDENIIKDELSTKSYEEYLAFTETLRLKEQQQ